MTTGVEVEKLGKRDLAKYGQADGPTFDQLRDKHLAAGAKTAEAFQRIIDSSQRSDEAIDRLFYAP